MTRMPLDARRAVIITASLAIARDHGLHHVNHGSVAKRCVVETSKKTVQYHFAKQSDLWRAVVAADASFTEAGKGLGL